MTSGETKPVPGLSSPSVPIYARAPPHPIPELPDVNPDNQMSVEQYFQLLTSKAAVFGAIGSDLVLKGVILDEIEKRPVMWDKSICRKNDVQKTYSLVAVNVFLRTGVLLSVPTLQRFLRTMKDMLRNKLKNAISKNLTSSQIEATLWKWDVYGYARFLRKNFEWYESCVVIDVSSDEEDELDLGMEVHEVSEDEDLVDDRRSPVDRSPEQPQNLEEPRDALQGEPPMLQEHNHRFEIPNPQPSHPFVCPRTPIHKLAQMQLSKMSQEPPVYQYYQRVSQYGQPVYVPPPTSSSHHQPIQPKRRAVSTLFNPYDQPGTSAEGLCDPMSHSASGESSPIPHSVPCRLPANPPITQEDVDQITAQIMRVGRNQPDKLPLLRKSLFDLILQFDLKDYSTAKEVFRDLANA